MNDLGFDLEGQEDPVDMSTPLPAGTYKCLVQQVEKVPYKNCEGEMAKLTFSVVEGTQKGRKIFENLNLWHPTSEKAVEIARSSLKGLCQAAGLNLASVKSVFDVAEKVVNVKLTVKNDKEYGPRNNVAAYVRADATDAQWQTPKGGIADADTPF